MLIYDPPIDLDVRLVGGAGTAATRTTSHDRGWVDVGFIVTAKGMVEDIEVLRQSPDVAGDWFERSRRSLAGRSYPANAQAPRDPGPYRVERFSLVRDARMDSGGAIANRSSGRVEMIDLTPDEVAAAPRR